jgi:hypothetical protein
MLLLRLAATPVSLLVIIVTLFLSEEPSAARPSPPFPVVVLHLSSHSVRPVLLCPGLIPLPCGGCRTSCSRVPAGAGLVPLSPHPHKLRLCQRQDQPQLTNPPPS